MKLPASDHQEGRPEAQRTLQGVSRLPSFRQAQTAWLALAAYGRGGSGSTLAPQPPALLSLWIRLPSLVLRPPWRRQAAVPLLFGPLPPSLLRPRLPSLAPAALATSGPSRLPPSLALPAPAFPVHPGPDRCGRWRAAGTAGCCKAHWAAGSVRARSAASGPGRSAAAAPSPSSAACWWRCPHSGGEAAGGRRRRGRGLGPAPRAWSSRQPLLRSRYRERPSQGGGSDLPSPASLAPGWEKCR